MLKQLLKGTAVLTLSFGIVSILNFSFYKIANFISPEDFGILIALISLTYFLTVFSEVFSGIVVKVMVDNQININNFIVKLTPLILLVELFISIVFLGIGNVFLKDFLKLEDTTLLYALASIIPSMLFVALFKGILRGKNKMNKLAAIQILEALFKLFAGMFSIFFGFKVFGILIGMGIAMLVNAIILYFFVKNIDGEDEFELTQLISGKALYSVTTSLVILNLMIALDALIARNTLSAGDAGIYSGVITYGKFVYFLAFSTITAAFPIFATKNEMINDKKNVFASLGIVSLMGLCIILFVLFWGKNVILLVLGDQYLDGANYLLFECIIMTIFSLLATISNYLIAKNRHLISVILAVGFLIFLIALLLFGKSILLMFIMKFIVITAMFICSLAYLLWTFRNGNINKE